MGGSERVFLTVEEALRAVRIDFIQYKAQTALFLDASPMILGPEIHLFEDPKRSGFWLSRAGHRKMRFLTVVDLRDRLCQALSGLRIPLHELSRLCGLVFETRACPGRSGTPPADGVWIETGMEAFRCRHCGSCCRILDYHKAITPADYGRWLAHGRTDILERVRVHRHGDDPPTFTVWIEPGGRWVSPVCPWLREEGHSGGRCAIYALRPAVCRHYPGSRKHARMTGCIGFSAD